jgi:hypothetical protein
VTIEVEVVVAGGVGDLVASMLGDFTVERCPVTTRLVVDADDFAMILSRLAEAEADVLSIVAVPTPDG